MYKKVVIEQRLKEAKGNLTDEEFLKEKCRVLLGLWINNPQHVYRYTGPYWERLYDILLKYAPKELNKYENRIGGFNYFNPEVKAEYTLNDDALDFMCMLAYMNDRMSAGAGLDSPHFIDLGDEECIPYLPNQALDHIVDW